MMTTDNQDELFVVVDEHDAVLGTKTRGECHANKTYIHRSIGVVIFNSQGRVLLQKRSRDKDTDPGFWTMSAGGHVQPQESYEEAMKREVHEELGITVPESPLFLGATLRRYSNESEMEGLFTFIFDGPFTSDRREVEELRFFDSDTLIESVRSNNIHLTQSVKIDLVLAGFVSTGAWEYNKTHG